MPCATGTGRGTKLDVTLANISQQNGIGRVVVQKAEAIKTELLIHGIDQCLFQQRSLLNKRRRSAYSILAERNRLVETSLKQASAISPDRVASPGSESG